jgi:hypothetical protein
MTAPWRDGLHKGRRRGASAVNHGVGSATTGAPSAG